MSVSASELRQIIREELLAILHPSVCQPSGGAFESWLAGQEDSVKAIVAHIRANPQDAHRIVRLSGGKLTRLGTIGEDGPEAGPEAIIPLKRADAADDLRSLRKEIAALREALSAQIGNAGRQARAARTAADDLDRIVNGGEFDNDTQALKPGNEWVQDGTGVSGQRPKPTPSSPREGGL